MPVEIKTFLDMQNEVLRSARQPKADATEADATVVEAIKGHLNRRYLQVAKRQKWRWRRKTRFLTIVAKHTTGTVSVTNGSRQLTFTGASIVANFLNRSIKITGREEYFDIIAVDETAQTVMLSQLYPGTTNATANYTIFKWQYGSWPDLEEIDDVINQHRTFGFPMPVGPERIYRLINMNPEREGKVRLYSIEGKTGFDNVTMGQFVMGYDFMGGQTLQTKKIITFPHIADEEHVVPISYIQRIDPMDANTDEPLMPIEDRIVPVYGALADFYSDQKDSQEFITWQSLFESELARMESDFQDTDDKTQLVVEDPYRTADRHGGRKFLHPSMGDLGQIFDDVDF